MSWLSNHLMQQVRRNLSNPPPKNETCFYGNPLGGMALHEANQIDRCLKQFKAENGITTVWDLLQKPSTQTLVAMNGFIKNNLPHLRDWILLWEMLNAERTHAEHLLAQLDNGPTDHRLPIFRETQAYPNHLWNAYERAMLRALTYLDKHEDDIPTNHFPTVEFDGHIHRPVSNARNAAIDFRAWREPFMPNKEKAWLKVLDVSPVATRLVHAKLGHDDKFDVNRGARGAAAGMKLESWKVGGSNQAERGRQDCPTAKLFVASAVENWLFADEALAKTLATAWESNVKDDEPAEAPPSHTPDTLADKVGLDVKLATGKAERFFAEGTRTQMDAVTGPVALTNCHITQGTWQPIIDAELRYPPWLTDGLTNCVAVIRTIANVNRERLPETVYADVLDVEDADESGNTVRVQLSATHPCTPLLDRWPLHARKLVAGKLELVQCGNRLMPVIGIIVYLM